MLTPFRIPVDEASLADLRSRLTRTRWPDEINDSQWSWGVDLTYLRHLVDAWIDFDWHRRVDEFNLLPQFRADIDDHAVHYFRMSSAQEAPEGRLPLMLLHGWPGSFAEMLTLVPHLESAAAANGVALDIVIPSLPGFGYSSRPTTPGTSPRVAATLLHRLMVQLGYPQYALQGGDIGAGIAIRMAMAEPDAVTALHLNYASFLFDGADDEPPGSIGRVNDLRREAWARTEGGYMHVHSTRPQTLGYALADSPVGLAAWIAERFHAWTDRRDSQGAVPIALDDILTGLCVYWFGETITSSMRIYKESAADPLALSRATRITVPTAVAAFPFELPIQPRERVAQVTNPVRWTDMPRGGHFAALEAPELLATDVLAFIAETARHRP